MYALSVALDVRYPNIVDECYGAMIAMRSPGLLEPNFIHREGCVSVLGYWKHWVCLFPQHGAGKKHERPIVLRNWQEDIAAANAGPLLRGLIHSDGCRVINRVRNGKTKKLYSYPRYQFSNRSNDIRGIFCKACDEFGIKWRVSNTYVISVSRGPDVAKLQQIVGPKS